MKIMNTRLAITTLILCSSAALAGDKILNADEVNKLIVGNTVHAEILANGKTFKAYFDASGKYTRLQDGNTMQDSFRTNADGTHCITFKGADNCASIKDNGDGTYTRIENGNPKIKWSKVVTGKDL